LVRPDKELKSFAKVALEPGETQTVTLTLDESALAYWDDSRGEWVAETGEFEVLVGSSSREIRVMATFKLAESG
jgi:beta-glucosidase